VKFCQYVASLYAHSFTSFGRFILLFNKMALFFLGGLSFLPFQVSSFSKSDWLDFIANDEWPQFTQRHPLDYQVCRQCKLQHKPETVPEFKNAL